MLSPNIRHIYIESLSPPPNYRLDYAVATTFSLDLMSLLIAPLSMVFHQCRNREDLLQDPIAVLESLKKTADRFVVFCQQGRILVPQQDSLLYSYLEKVIYEVQPPKEDGVFHPKTWLLRFVASGDDMPILYRFLCLSKNLTFDHSWDTILKLEGYLDKKRTIGFSRNRPLRDFFKTLPNLAKQNLSQTTIDSIARLTDEVLRVRFEAPSVFENRIGFIPLGIPGYTRYLKLEPYRKLMILSPFITDDTIAKLTRLSKDNIVISRLESLDGLSDKTMHKVQNSTQFYFLDEAAEVPEGLTESVSQQESNKKNIPRSRFSGLHTKLVITEDGYQTNVYTGSANATSAGFSGKNVEFMVQLSGRRKNVGIQKFLGSEDDKQTLRNMLRPYYRVEKSDQTDKLSEELENMLEKARKSIIKLNLSMTISKTSQKTYDLKIIIKGNERYFLSKGVEGVCYLISLGTRYSKDIGDLSKKQIIQFDGISIAALTCFVAFDLHVEKEIERASLSFVLNLPVEGMPEDRDRYILHQIIADRRRFLQYLLFLLAEEDSIPFTSEHGYVLPFDLGEGLLTGHFDEALLEELVRAFSRHPEKLDRIEKLVIDLKKTDHYEELIPKGFDEVWSVFLKAQSEKIAE